jgi:hypothetical protein
MSNHTDIEILGYKGSILPFPSDIISSEHQFHGFAQVPTIGVFDDAHPANSEHDSGHISFHVYSFFFDHKPEKRR